MFTFDSCFEKVVGIEGGYSNDLRDPGGETKYGISHRAHPNEDIKNLTLERAKQIYRADYWDKLGLDALPPELWLYLFDTAVNCGPDFAAESLQRAAGCLPDGQIGKQTQICVKAKGAHSLVRLMFVERAMRYALNQNDKLYGRGWFARLYDITYLTLCVIDPRVSGQSGVA